MYMMWFFFFKQKTAYEMRISDWSSDVCSSDLEASDVGADTGTDTGTGTGDTSSANDSSLSEPANGGDAPDLSEVGNSAAPVDTDVPEAPQPGPVAPVTGGQ